MRITAFSLYAVVTIGLCILEWSYQLKPVIVVPQNQIIYVMGDSISAGIGTNEHNWPEVWGKLSGRQIINLAKPGATVADVLRDQCPGIISSNAVVMVEIGGNDLLGSTKAGDFHDQLDQLLFRLRSGGHRVILFELPLLPFCNRYGSAQRALAGKYGVTLISKRVMVRVFGMNGATLDGLHLSQPGHDEMARLVHEMVTTGP